MGLCYEEVFCGIMIEHSIPVLDIAFLQPIYCCLLYTQFSFVEQGNGHKKKNADD